MSIEVPPGTPVNSCMSCGRRIHWVKTAAGKNMPVDAEKVNGEWRSHFSSCPNADKHRGNPRQAGLFSDDGGRKG